jgi:hypothetical protein
MAQNERAIIRQVSERAPLVETYLQVYGANGDGLVDDRYYVSRVREGKGLLNDIFVEPSDVVAGRTSKKASFREHLGHFTQLTIEHRPLTYDAVGFMELLGPDIHGFSPGRYRFQYLGTEYLGDVRTAVFNVEPKHSGLFNGRIWVESDGNLVRFTGRFTPGSSESRDHPRYVHFDSWRTNVGSGLWLPSSIYVEQKLLSGEIHGQVRLWGYGLIENQRKAGDHVSVTIDNAVDRTDSGADVDPLTALREWSRMGSANALEKLQHAGLLSPAGGFDTVLDQIATNIIIPNNLSFDAPVHCRVLLTTPIEALTVGSTIVLSKGLIESLPNEESIASVIAFELAHLSTDGNKRDARYSFADATNFSDSSMYRKMPLAHSEEQNVRAAELAVSYLRKSMYTDKLTSVGLYYRQMEAVAGRLKCLYLPSVGDSLVSPEGRPWLLSKMLDIAPHLSPGDTSQVAALPLGSNLLVDAWTGQVSLNTAPRPAPEFSYEKRPFEVMPVYYRLRASHVDLIERENHTPALAGADAAGGSSR